MFLLVSVRHVGAHPVELQHGVSIQSSINLGKKFPRISRIRITFSTQILARVFVYLPPFTSQILDFICRMVLIFFFDLFWMAWHRKPAIQLVLILKFAVGAAKLPGLSRNVSLIWITSVKGTHSIILSPCTLSSQAFSVNAFQWLVRVTWPETHRPRGIMRPRD